MSNFTDDLVLDVVFDRPMTMGEYAVFLELKAVACGLMIRNPPIPAQAVPIVKGFLDTSSEDMRTRWLIDFIDYVSLLQDNAEWQGIRLWALNVLQRTLPDRPQKKKL